MPLGGGPGADSGHAEEIEFLGLLLVLPEELEEVAGKGGLGVTSYSAAPVT